MSAIPDAPPVIRLYETGHPRSGRLLLADVADLSSLPDNVRQRAGSMVLGRYSSGALPQSLPADAVVSRARALMPGLAQWLPARPSNSIQLRWSTAALGPEIMKPCLRVTRAINPGTPAAMRYFEAQPCPDPPVQRAFRYDGTRRTVMTTRALVAGEVVRSFAGVEEGGIIPGDQVKLRAGAGPIVVERPVEVLQSARPGERLFVRTADGAVLAISFQGQGR